MPSACCMALLFDWHVVGLTNSASSRFPKGGPLSARVPSAEAMSEQVPGRQLLGALLGQGVGAATQPQRGASQRTNELLGYLHTGDADEWPGASERLPLAEDAAVEPVEVLHSLGVAGEFALDDVEQPLGLGGVSRPSPSPSRCRRTHEFLSPASA